MLKVKTHRLSKSMGVNSAKMIILVWTVTSVCEASDDLCISSSCADVTGPVREVLTLTCRILLNCSKQADQCCIKYYMFKDEKNTVICKKELPGETCEQEINATCVYTPSENRTATFMHFLQANCGTKKTEFIVNVTESGEAITEAIKKGEAKPTTSEVTVTVFAIIAFIVIMLIIYRKYNPTIPCQLQRDYRSADSATKDDDTSE